MPNATLCALRRVMYRPDQRGDRRLFHRRRSRAGAWRGYLGVQIWVYFSMEPICSALLLRKEAVRDGPKFPGKMSQKCSHGQCLGRFEPVTLAEILADGRQRGVVHYAPARLFATC